MYTLGPPVLAAHVTSPTPANPALLPLISPICPRVELVDEPAQYVAPLLEGYRQALQAAAEGGGSSGAQGAQQMWRWMQALPDANGRAHGVGLGSLEARAERDSSRMKPTAASLR